MATSAPKDSFRCTFSFLINIATGISSTGVIDVNVEATPGLVCCMASNDNEIPKNGPKNEPSVINFIALFSLNAAKNEDQLPLIEKSITNPTIPAINLI